MSFIVSPSYQIHWGTLNSTYYSGNVVLTKGVPFSGPFAGLAITYQGAQEVITSAYFDGINLQFSASYLVEGTVCTSGAEADACLPTIQSIPVTQTVKIF